MKSSVYEQAQFLVCDLCQWPTAEFAASLEKAQKLPCRKCGLTMLVRRRFTSAEWTCADCSHPALSIRLDTRSEEYIRQCMDCGACTAGGTALGR